MSEELYLIIWLQMILKLCLVSSIALDHFLTISGAKSSDRQIHQSCSPSLTLNYENRFVVDLIPCSSLQSMFVTFLGVLQQRIADVSC
jgi:hypothetical protein